MENFLIMLGLFILCLMIFGLVSFCLYSDYQQLFQQIQQDKRFDKLTDEKKFIEFQQIIEEREDKLYDIKFYADGKIIKINLINF